MFLAGDMLTQTRRRKQKEFTYARPKGAKSGRKKRLLTDATSASQNVVIRAMPQRILSVSYDYVLLETRRMLLEQKGYSVTSALGFREAVEQCQNGAFDLFILGHSIPYKDKVHLIETFRGSCPNPILSLERFGEKQVPCDFHASPDNPEKFLQVVDGILAGKENRSQRRSA